MGLFHAAWHLFADRWLNIPARPLSEPPEAAPLAAASAGEGVEEVARAVQTLDVHGARREGFGYLAGGLDADLLLQRLGVLILWNDTGARVLPTLCAVATSSRAPGAGTPPSAPVTRRPPSWWRPGEVRHRRSYEQGERRGHDHGPALRRGPHHHRRIRRRGAGPAMSTNGDFVKVASVDEVAEGQPKAVRVEGRSVALFEHQGRYYATDNQCPHMGYPLTRGIVRNGVLTCDWHGYSYDWGAAAASPAAATTSTPFRWRCGTGRSTST